MTLKPALKFSWLHQAVGYHFDFLFEMGFCIASTIFTERDGENWQMVMISDDFLVRLRCDQGTVRLGLSSLKFYDQIGFFDLDTLLQLSGNDDVLYDLPAGGCENEGQQIEKLSLLLEKYRDDIFVRVTMLSILLLSRLLPAAEFNQNGRSFMDDRPFAL